MAGSDILLTSEEVKQFIDLWEAQPMLWNPADKEYKHRHVRTRAYHAISEAMGHGWTEDQVKRKIESLRAQYNRCKKGMEKKGGVGNGCCTTWVHYDQIRSFLCHAEGTADELVNRLLVHSENSSFGGDSEADNFYVELNNAAEEEDSNQQEDNANHNSCSSHGDPPVHFGLPQAETDEQPVSIKTEIIEDDQPQIVSQVSHQNVARQNGQSVASNHPLTSTQLLAVSKPVTLTQPVPITQPITGMQPILVSTSGSQPVKLFVQHNNLTPSTQLLNSTSPSVFQPNQRSLLPASNLPPAAKVYPSSSPSVFPTKQKPTYSLLSQQRNLQSSTLHSQQRRIMPTINRSASILKRKKAFFSGDSLGMKEKLEGSRETPLLVKIEEPISVLGSQSNTHTCDHSGGHTYRNYGLSLGDRLSELKNRKVVLELMHKIDTALYEAAMKDLDDDS